jgi:DNA-binding transcriptional ArsR family regulator
LNTAEAVKALAALAQGTRLAVYRLLVQRGVEGMSVGAIAEGLDLPPATLSFHLKELANAGMAQSRQDGRFVFYSANYERMNGLLGYLTQNCCQGQDSAACAPSAASTRKRA